MENRNLLWKLYESNAYDTDYNRNQQLPWSVKQVYNPAPTIIDIDLSLINKGFDVTGNARLLMDSNDWTFTSEYLLLLILIDGRAWVDIARTPEGIILSPINMDELKDIKYDAGGNIIYAQFEVDSGEIKVSKEYYLDRIIQAIDDETTEYPNTFGFIPLVEFNGMKSSGNPISRLDNLVDSLDLYNEYCADIKSIGKLHADPLMFGNVDLDTDTMADKDEARKDRASRSTRYLGVPEGGVLSFLEMQGNVMRIMAEEKDKLKEQIQQDYPELMLSTIMAGAGMSGYSVYLKLISLDSVIQKYRNNYIAGLHQTFDMALEMLGVSDDYTLVFDKIVPDDPAMVISQVIQAFSADLLTREAASRKVMALLEIEEEDIPTDPEGVYQRQWEAATRDEGEDEQA